MRRRSSSSSSAVGAQYDDEQYNTGGVQYALSDLLAASGQTSGTSSASEFARLKKVLDERLSE